MLCNWQLLIKNIFVVRSVSFRASCSATGASNYLMKLIPKAVKVSTIVGMGLQIALLGMMSVNLVVKNDVHIWMARCAV